MQTVDVAMPYKGFGLGTEDCETARGLFAVKYLIAQSLSHQDPSVCQYERYQFIRVWGVGYF